MAEAFSIRPVAAGDRADWGRLWRGYLAFYRTELPEELYDTLFARLMAPGEDGPFGMVAETGGASGGELVGLVHYLYHLHCWRPEGVVYLQDLYVAPAARGKGVARGLIEAVYGAADAVGKPSVYWTTEAGNMPARMLYDRVGVLTPFVKYARG